MSQNITINESDTIFCEKNLSVGSVESHSSYNEGVNMIHFAPVNVAPNGIFSDGGILYHESEDLKLLRRDGTVKVISNRNTVVPKYTVKAAGRRTRTNSTYGDIYLNGPAIYSIPLLGRCVFGTALSYDILARLETPGEGYFGFFIDNVLVSETKVTSSTFEIYSNIIPPNLIPSSNTDIRIKFRAVGGNKIYIDLVNVTFN